MIRSTCYCLDPEWKFHPGDLAVHAGTSHSAVYLSTKAGGIGGPAGKLSYDDSTWETVDLPHDYIRKAPFSPDAVKSQGYRVKENAWYRKTFLLDPADSEKHALLVFEGIATSSEIYLNGSLLRRSFSGYTEIAVDVTDRLYFDRVNTLAVYTKGDANEGWWYEGAGIYRHVYLYLKNPAHIAHNGLWAKPVPANADETKWNVELETTVENAAYTDETLTVRATLWDGDTVTAVSEPVTALCEADRKTPVFSLLSVTKPERWDVDHPKLYSLTVELLRGNDILDTATVQTGFRTVRVDAKKGFFLNGRQLKIKGVCCHQDHAGVGVGVPDSIQDYRIRLLKEMGCNAYRCAHGPHAKEILDACDRYGLLVMDENRTFETGEDPLRNWEITVRRDRNHPSVVFYSLFNEEPLQSTAEGKKIFRRLRSLTEKLDTTRIITGAVNDRIVSGGTSEGMDVFGANYGLKRMDGNHEQFPALPIIGSENCSAVSVRGCWQSDNDAHLLNCYDEEIVPWGSTVRANWDYVQKHEFFSGIFIWTGFDYRGEPTPFDWPTCNSLFGVMDLCGFPKGAYYFTQAVFCDSPMLKILPHWNWKPGDTVRVMTVSNCEEVELFLNGTSLGRRKNDVCEQNEWMIPFEAGTLSAVGYRDGKQAASDEVRTAGKAVRILLTPDRTFLSDDGTDAVPVRVSLMDENGTEVPCASDLIRFTVSGNGSVLGIGNGDPNSHEAEHLPQQHLFNGLCQVLVGANRNAGFVTLTAEADGLIPATIPFEIRKVPKRQNIYLTENHQVTGILVTPNDSPVKPDPTRVYADNDMNSFAPLEIDSKKYTKGFSSGWREYRIPVTLPNLSEGETPFLHFASVKCEQAEFYLNGKRIHSVGRCRHAEFSVALPQTTEKTFEIRALLQALPNDELFSGFTREITLISGKH